MKSVQSMTGFASVEGEVGNQHYRVEARAVNHRSLDLKVRLPRELAPAEMLLRASVQGRFQRGAIEIKFDRAGEAASVGSEINMAAAKHYFRALQELGVELGVKEPPRLSDLLQLPDVLSRGTVETPADEIWKKMESLAVKCLDRLQEMRAHEGTTLTKVLIQAIGEMESKLTSLRARRKVCEGEWHSRIADKVKTVFDAYPMAASSAQAVLETRIAQELALLVERTDIEEELIRFGGHLAHLRKTLEAGGPVGRKIDFILQEMHREINTLGNKAQDLAMSEDVVQVKLRLEQLREQVMNLE